MERMTFKSIFEEHLLPGMPKEEISYIEKILQGIPKLGEEIYRGGERSFNFFVGQVLPIATDIAERTVEKVPAAFRAMGELMEGKPNEALKTMIEKGRGAQAFHDVFDPVFKPIKEGIENIGGIRFEQMARQLEEEGDIGSQILAAMLEKIDQNPSEMAIEALLFIPPHKLARLGRSARTLVSKSGELAERARFYADARLQSIWPGIEELARSEEASLNIRNIINTFKKASPPEAGAEIDAMNGFIRRLKDEEVRLNGELLKAEKAARELRLPTNEALKDAQDSMVAPIQESLQEISDAITETEQYIDSLLPEVGVAKITGKLIERFDDAPASPLVGRRVTRPRGFETLQPRTVEWMEYWAKHPEEQEEMLAYMRRLDAELRAREAHLMRREVKPTEEEIKGIPEPAEMVEILAPKPKPLMAIKAKTQKRLTAYKERLGTETYERLAEKLTRSKEITDELSAKVFLSVASEYQKFARRATKLEEKVAAMEKALEVKLPAVKLSTTAQRRKADYLLRKKLGMTEEEKKAFLLKAIGKERLRDTTAGEMSVIMEHISQKLNKVIPSEIVNMDLLLRRNGV
ncbi:MAG: hypothetical protein AB1552_14110, partial [Nitrospirota bacterium]